MKTVRVLIADESPVMRRWYAAALSRIAHDVEEYENGWQLLNRLADEKPYDLVVASKWLPGIGGAQILAMLRTAETRVPFVLVAPFGGASVQALARRMPDCALVDDPLDVVRLAEAARALLSAVPADRGPERQRNTARVLRAHARTSGSGPARRIA